MKIRIFSTPTVFAHAKGSIDLPSVPRAGESILARDPEGAVYYTVHKVLHVEGADPIAFVLIDDGGQFDGFDVAESGLTAVGALKPLDLSLPGGEDEEEVDTETPPLGL